MGVIIPFPGVNLDERVAPPVSLDARSFADMFEEARAIGDAMGRLRLTPSERRILLTRDPHTCEICGGNCWPLGGMWWDARSGFLHNYFCRYPDPDPESVA